MKRYHLLQNNIDISILKNVDNTRVIWGSRPWSYYGFSRFTKETSGVLQKSHGRFDLRLAVDLSDEHIVLLKLQGLYVDEVTENQLSVKLRKRFKK